VPAASVDTFFACSLMVLLVLSAMASTSKILYPYINYASDKNVAEKYRQISKYLLLNAGTPSNWGENNRTALTTFGLAKVGSENPYDLDRDKVSRLSSENIYAISYAQAFSTLKMPDITFRIEIKPMFEVAIRLEATYEEANRTVYQFAISLEKHGSPVLADLQCYVVAEDFVGTTSIFFRGGKTYVNATLPNTIIGPALIIVFAKSAYDSRIVSFSSHAFAHNSRQPTPNRTFLRLSPLNHTLTATFIQPNVTLMKAYAFTFNYNSTLTQVVADSYSAIFAIPHFADSSPTLIVATGTNSTTFFTEVAAYPQIPLQTGADFENLETRTTVFAYTYSVTIESAIYECTIWLGGPRD
jgi:hypothetical protein